MLSISGFQLLRCFRFDCSGNAVKLSESQKRRSIYFFKELCQMPLFNPLTYYFFIWSVFGFYYHTRLRMDREQVTWGNLNFHLSSLIYGFGLLGFYIWLFTIKWYYPLQIFLYTTTGDIIFFAAEAFIVKKLLSMSTYMSLMSWLSVLACPFLSYLIVTGMLAIK